ncbi:hypothetical protein [Devosia rhizoryzae]|uniref:Uncharacterized protein n=1 Tax=Devosia rhizoryzae TaxID=2774137 RepID=A0ABX7C7I6_9HYPH|nr:hypothetical protein [Devosia rhizoryzae]QQR40171.1 hypothetical protein JI748_03925 [Devosia rhizoryzae]
MIDKKQEVAFLADEFKLSARRAAALIAGTPEEAGELTMEQLEAEKNRDPYGDVPVPVSPEEHEIEGNGGLQKTVVRRENKASRTGP